MTTLLVSISDAHQTLSISRSQLYELIAKKRLKAVRVGRRRLIPMSELEAYVESLKSIDGAA